MDYQSAGHFDDDEIYDTKVRNLASGARLTAVMDSGTGMDLPHIHESGGHGQGMDMEQDMQLARLKKAKRLTKRMQLCLRPNPFAGEVLLFSGVRDNPVAVDAFDTSQHARVVTGAITYCVIEAIENGNVGCWQRYTYRSLLHEMREKLRDAKHKQVHQFSTSHQFDLSSPFII